MSCTFTVPFICNSGTILGDGEVITCSNMDENSLPMLTKEGSPITIPRKCGLRAPVAGPADRGTIRPSRNTALLEL
jgi:hypothetical protein